MAIENWNSKPGGSKSDDDSGGYKAVLFILIGSLTILSLPSLIIGFLLYYYLLRRLKKIEKIFIGLTAVIFIILRFENTIKNYYEWVLSVLSVSDISPLSNIPLIEILFISVIISLIFDIMFSARISSKFPDKKMLNIFNPKETPISSGILPNVFERENSKLIVSSGISISSENIVADSSTDTQIEKRVNIGVDKEGKMSSLSEEEARTHVLLFGSTGSGKTEAIKTIIGSLLDLGWNGTVLDLKEDTGEGGLAEWCKLYADSHALPYQELTATGEFGNFWFNPLLGMGPDEARDTIVGAQQFDDGYYRSLNEKQLGQLLRLCYTVNQIDPIKYPKVSVYDLGKILAAPDLTVATKEMVATVISNYPSVKKDDFDSLIRPDKAMAEAAGGLGARLTALYETEVARRVLRPNNSKLEIDITNNGLSYIGLSSSGLPEISRLVSTSILRRMAVFVSDRINGKLPKKKPHFLVIDEANFVNRKMLLELLSRARGAWVSVIVATQGPTDFLTNIPGEPGLESLVQNTNISIILNQGERSNAELCADIIGRGERLSFSHNVREGVLSDVTGSARSIVDYLVGPDELRRLPQGEAIIRVGKPNEWVKWIKFPLRNPKS